MIHIELSVEPHAKHCTWQGVHLAEGSRPPHVIREWQFETWGEVEKWHREMGFKTDSDVLGDVVKQGLRDDKGTGEDSLYVQHELDVLDVTGQEYTGANLAIEGQQKKED